MARTFAGFSHRPLRDPHSFAVSARQGGGYEQANYNPNSAVNQYKLAQGLEKGQYTSPQFGNQPAVSNELGLNLDLAQRASAHDQAVADEERIERRRGSMQNPYLKDKRWSTLLHALSEAGADRLNTGARMGWEQPGFFDTQNTMDAGAQGRQQMLEALLMNQGRNADAAFVRGLR